MLLPQGTSGALALGVLFPSSEVGEASWTGVQISISKTGSLPAFIHSFKDRGTVATAQSHVCQEKHYEKSPEGNAVSWAPRVAGMAGHVSR